MAIYRFVHISFWQDPFVIELPVEEKYFFLYLMTNSRTTQCGIYEINKKLAAIETGFTKDKLDQLLKKFVGYKKILYDDKTNEVFIINWIKHNSLKSPKVASCILKELASVKNKGYVDLFYKHCDLYGYTIHRLSIDLGEKEEPEPEPEEKPEEESEIRDSPPPYQKIVDLFNQICTKLPQIQKLTDSRREKIRTRWIEIGNIDEFKRLFEMVNATPFLCGDNKSNWKATFDWLIENDKNYIKVLEGSYAKEKGGRLF